MAVFNHEFFQHLYDNKKKEFNRDSKALKLIITLFKAKIFIYPLSFIEWIITRILTLPIPIYSGIILYWITNLNGLPGMLGCYIRALYFKGRLKKMGHNVLIDRGAVISNPGQVELADFSFIDKYVIIAAKSAKIGRRVHIAPFVIVTGGGDFEIEDFACIATGSSVVTSTETLKSQTRSSGPMVHASQRDVLRGFVKIKKDAFIGAKATILTNVTIAEGCVIGAGTTISKDTEPWSIYVLSGGKPVIIKKRDKLELPDL